MNYEKVAKQFSQFFNTEELLTTLNRKADIELIERLQATKAPKTDLETTNSLIDACNLRIKHISIVMTELAKAFVPSKASSSFKNGENINTKIQRRDFLSKQAQIVNSWISDSNNTSFIGVPKSRLTSVHESMMQSEVPAPILEFEKFHLSNK